MLETSMVCKSANETAESVSSLQTIVKGRLFVGKIAFNAGVLICEERSPWVML